MVVKVEAHYDNASGQPQTDKSGMRLTLTPDLRPLVTATVELGMTTVNKDFSIPPQSENHVLTNICPPEVSSMLDHPVYVYSLVPHMHNYGRTLYTEHWRCGVKIGEVGRIENYDLNNQLSYSLAHPTKIFPGDALVTKCHYNQYRGSGYCHFGWRRNQRRNVRGLFALLPSTRRFSHIL